MSTQIVNASGSTVAIRFYGGKARGLCLEVFLPENLMKDCGKTLVHEQGSPNYQMTLRKYISDVEKRGGTTIYRQPGIHGPLSQVDKFNSRFDCGR